MSTCLLAHVNGIPRPTSVAGGTGWRYCWRNCADLVRVTEEENLNFTQVCINI